MHACEENKTGQKHERHEAAENEAAEHCEQKSGSAKKHRGR